MTSGRPGRREREARIKLQHAGHYPGINAGEWMPAWLLAERLFALARERGLKPGERICDPSHCEFRGGGRRPPELLGLRTRVQDG